jgi:hypothetical protein
VYRKAARWRRRAQHRRRGRRPVDPSAWWIVTRLAMSPRPRSPVKRRRRPDARPSCCTATVES